MAATTHMYNYKLYNKNRIFKTQITCRGTPYYDDGQPHAPIGKQEMQKGVGQPTTPPVNVGSCRLKYPGFKASYVL